MDRPLRVSSPVVHRPRIALLVALLLALALLPAQADAATTVKGTALKLLRGLATARERPAGYHADRFPYPRSVGNGCDAREAVLIAESLRDPRIGPGCTVISGRWRSVYDGRVTTNASTFDIDHVVALKEAWRSGARRWSKARRQAYANDVGDPRSLRAVSASSNRSKGDRDPSAWMPPKRGVHCRYLGWWVAVKVRWKLAVDTKERTFIRDRLRGCPARTLRVRLA